MVNNYTTTAFTIQHCAIWKMCLCRGTGVLNAKINPPSGLDCSGSEKKSSRVNITIRLPSDICNAHTHQNDGASCRAQISVSFISNTSALIHVRRPVCLPPNRLHYSCCHFTPSDYHQPPTIESICNSGITDLDFSKAFDTVRHSTLLAKMAQLDLPVPVSITG